MRFFVPRLRFASVRAPPAAFAKLSPAPPVPVGVPPTGKEAVPPADEKPVGPGVTPVTIAPRVTCCLAPVDNHESSSTPVPFPTGVPEGESSRA